MAEAFALVREAKENFENSLEGLYSRILAKFSNYSPDCNGAVECVAHLDCLLSLAQVRMLATFGADKAVGQ